MQKAIARGTFPGAQFVVGEGGKIIAQEALGQAVITPERIPATVNTVYDLASLTKPLLTALLTVIFAERGNVDLSAPASDYLEELRTPDKRDITLLQLLTHTSGLQAWRPLYLEARARADVVAAIARAPRDNHGAARTLYGDLNFILLGFMLERVTGERLDRIAQKEVFEPLQLSETYFPPPSGLKREVAATESGQTHERKTIAEMKIVCPAPAPGDTPDTGPRPLRRKQIIWGEVHDGNAYFMEGVAGHAGLFSTAREVFQIANQFIPGSKLLNSQSLTWFTDTFTPGAGDARSVGWMLARTKDCSAGAALPPDAFGHTGFTGTSLWIDWQKQRVYVLLTNRVHPQVRDLGLKQARQQFHGLAVEALNRLNESADERAEIG
jgi:CubicO group peptidase (beta-lactamase class C family)